MHSHVPMFGFILLSFLLLAVVLAVAVFFAFKSGEAGRTKLSGPAGCFIALALLGIAGMGAIGLGIVSIVTLGKEVVRHGPVKSIELREEEDERGSSRADRGAGGLRVTIELRGLEDPKDVLKWLRRRTDAETQIAVRDGRDERGEALTVIELSLPADHEAARELREMRRDLEKDAPELKLPSGVKIEFRGPEED